METYNKHEESVDMEMRKLEESLGSNDFVITPSEVDIILSSTLRRSEYSLFKRLVKYLPYNSGVLMRRDYPDEYATLNYLIKDLKDNDGNRLYTKQALMNLMTELRKRDIIASYKTTDSSLCYLINPWVAYRGNKSIDESVFRTFKDSRWRSIPR